MNRKNRKRRIMREFEIHELSAVDRPAQGHAKMTLIKRDDTENDLRTEKTSCIEPLSFPTFEHAVQHMRMVHGLPGCGAMSKAARQYPDLLEVWQAEDRKQLGKVIGPRGRARTKPQAVRDFELLVEVIVERDGVSRRAAMQRARRENPEKFRAFQQA